MTKKIIYVVGIVIGVVALIGSYYYPKVLNNVGASPSGSTFGDAKTASVVISLASPGANGTSTSILNTDTNDRYVTSWHTACENMGTSKTAYTGAGLANLQESVGTTTTAAPATFISFSAIASGFNLATGTTNMLVSSSTLATATSSLAIVWPANTYMTFSFNATNTAVCTTGVNYIGS